MRRASGLTVAYSPTAPSPAKYDFHTNNQDTVIAVPLFQMGFTQLFDIHPDLCVLQPTEVMQAHLDKVWVSLIKDRVLFVSKPGAVTVRDLLRESDYRTDALRLLLGWWQDVDNPVTAQNFLPIGSIEGGTRCPLLVKALGRPPVADELCKDKEPWIARPIVIPGLKQRTDSADMAGPSKWQRIG